MALHMQLKTLMAFMPQQTRCVSRLSNAAVTRRRAELYDAEEARQKQLVARVEKMEVRYQGVPEDCTLMMNRDLSTPYDCARHISGAIVEHAALAEVNGEPWDMHRPLEGDQCTLRYCYFQDSDPFHVNRAFWRSCSLMLGAVIEEAFKDEHYVQLHSFPSPNVRSGSFVYDVALPMKDWRPSPEELRVLSAMMRRLAQRALPLRRLQVPAEVALQMFADNEYKRAQVPNIAHKSDAGDRVTLYRCGDHVDLSRGPVVSHTGLLGRCSITAVHPIQADCGQLHRFQGVALSSEFMLNHFAYGILEERARELNRSRIPYASSQVEAPESQADLASEAV